jgi:hypothetical protein
MNRKNIVAVPMLKEFKAQLELEAWQERMTLAAYVRRLLERSRTPDGKPRKIAAMRSRGRPRGGQKSE